MVSRYTAESANDLEDVYEELGSSIGYDVEQQEVTWAYALAAALVLALDRARLGRVVPAAALTGILERR